MARLRDPPPAVAARAQMDLAVAVAVVQAVAAGAWSAFAWQVTLASRADAVFPSSGIHEQPATPPAILLGSAVTIALAAGCGALAASTRHTTIQLTRVALALACLTLPALLLLRLEQGANCSIVLLFSDALLWRAGAASVVGLSVGGLLRAGAPALPLAVTAAGATLAFTAIAWIERVLWTVELARDIPRFVNAVSMGEQALVGLALFLVLRAARQLARTPSPPSAFPWAASVSSVVALGWAARLFPFVADAALPLPPPVHDAVPFVTDAPPPTGALDCDDRGRTTAPPPNARVVVWDGGVLTFEGVLFAETAPEAEATGMSSFALDLLNERLIEEDERRAAIGQPTPTPLVLVTPIDAPARAVGELVRAAREQKRGSPNEIGTARRVLRGCLRRATLSTRTQGDVSFIGLQVRGDLNPHPQLDGFP